MERTPVRDMTEKTKLTKKSAVDLQPKMVKLERAHGECLGTRSRRRTRRTAKRLVEL